MPMCPFSSLILCVCTQSPFPPAHHWSMASSLQQVKAVPSSFLLHDLLLELHHCLPNILLKSSGEGHCCLFIYLLMNSLTIELLSHFLVVQSPYHRLSVLLRPRLVGQLIPILFKPKYFSSGFLDRGTIHIIKGHWGSQSAGGKLDGFQTNLLSRKFLLAASVQREDVINRALGKGQVFPSSEFSAWWCIIKVYNKVGN